MKTFTQFLKEDQELTKSDIVVARISTAFRCKTKVTKVVPNGKSMAIHMNVDKITDKAYEYLVDTEHFFCLDIFNNQNKIDYHWNKDEIKSMIRDGQEIEFDKPQRVIVTVR